MIRPQNVTAVTKVFKDLWKS